MLRRTSRPLGLHAVRAAAAAVVIAASARAGEPVPNDDGARVQWLRDNALVVRTIDPSDDDFDDLMPLVDLIGDSRVVSLGDQTHGDGATFHAKCRLVRFLHERMGFDVLVWESGYFDCVQVERALRAGEPIDEAVGRGIFPIWGVSAQVRPLLRYVQATRATDRPLEIAGFDCQITSPRTGPALGAELGPIIARLDADRLSEADRETILGILARMTAAPYGFTRAEHESFQASMARLVEALDPEAQDVVEPERAAVLQRIVRNKATFEAMMYVGTLKTEDEARQHANRMEMGRLREEAMADNLIWLVRSQYPDRKLIVWAATSHMSFGEKTVEIGGGDEWSFMGGAWTPMGEAVRASLGHDLYTVAFIAHRGRIGSVAGWSRDLEPAPAGSLDDLCHRTGAAALFVDLRTLPNEAGGAWLRERLVARPRGYADMRADWSRCCDAMFFIDVMYPSTRVPRRD
jgi:erythromycin esterase